MKQLEDNRTGDFFGLPGRGRGRPRGAVAALSSAERQHARRERLKASGKSFLTVELSVDVLLALDLFVRFKDFGKNEAVERILRDRLLRKR